MDRRKFLAFIPAVSALPFVGAEVLQTESGILLKKPEPIEVVKKISKFDFSKISFQLMQEGVVIGKGYVTQLSMEQELDRELNMPMNRSIEVGGVINGALIDLGK